MIVLGIETSCDETGVALYATDHGLLAHHLYSQTALHAEYGGVVPELASRDHIKRLLPLVQRSLQEAGLQATDLGGIAYTQGPGLIGALLVGAAFARSIGWIWGIPTIGVHHLEGHLLATMLEDPCPAFPFLALLVSGGHTLLMIAQDIGKYQILGETLDDAVGEAFDKTAKLLGLPYPGGAVLAQLAKKGRKGRFHFSRPMLDRPGVEFSFSGLKTQVLNTWRRVDHDEQTRADIALAFEEAVVETLVVKCQRALQISGLRSLVVAGGVGANESLRFALREYGEQHGIQLFFPRVEFCTDNGAMIAYAGWRRLQAGYRDVGLEIIADPRWELVSDSIS